MEELHTIDTGNYQKPNKVLYKILKLYEIDIFISILPITIIPADIKYNEGNIIYPSSMIIQSYYREMLYFSKGKTF